MLKRDTAGNVVLHGKGRDLIDIEKAVTFNRESCTWTIAGEPHELRASAERKAILAAMKEIGAPATPNEIAVMAGVKKDTVRHSLPKMAKEGLVKRTNYGKYELQATNGGGMNGTHGRMDDGAEFLHPFLGATIHSRSCEGRSDFQ